MFATHGRMQVTIRASPTPHKPPFPYRDLNMYFLTFFSPPEGRPLRRNKFTSDAYH